jgi:PAS domain S-box-containing protein
MNGRVDHSPGAVFDRVHRRMEDKFMGKTRFQEQKTGFQNLGSEPGRNALRIKQPSLPQWPEHPAIVMWQAGAASRRFTYVSPQAVQLLGFPLENWLQENFWVTRLHPADREETVSKCREQIYRGASRDYELQYRMCAADGRVVWIYEFVHGVASTAGDPQMQGFMVEISARGLAKAAGESKRLETEILRISEREQIRIGQDLHDGLGQDLASIACLSAFLHQELNKKNLPEAETSRKLLDLLGQAIYQVRSIARGLYPVEPKPDGLQESLAQLAFRTEEFFQVQCRFVSDPAIIFEDPSRATHLYRIAQEATHNAIRHGKATSILFELTSTGKELVLSIQDNGGGIPFQLEDKPHPGLGLRTMGHRADLAGGTLEIRSEPGNTKIICSIPLPPLPLEGNA